MLDKVQSIFNSFQSIEELLPDKRMFYNKANTDFIRTSVSYNYVNRIDKKWCIAITGKKTFSLYLESSDSKDVVSVLYRKRCVTVDVIDNLVVLTWEKVVGRYGDTCIYVIFLDFGLQTNLESEFMKSQNRIWIDKDFHYPALES